MSAVMTESRLSYRDWHIPLQQDDISLGDACASLKSIAAEEYQIPLLVKLVENPRFSMPGFRLFHGAVDLHQHDCIHMLLGRGLLEMDEAFVIGFTMGSTNKVTTTEETLFGWIARYLYPKIYKFSEQHLVIFRDAVRLGYISSCQSLDKVDFQALQHKSLKEVRAELGLEPELLETYYRMEKNRYPNSAASQRLLDR